MLKSRQEIGFFVNNGKAIDPDLLQLFRRFGKAIFDFFWSINTGTNSQSDTLHRLNLLLFEGQMKIFHTCNRWMFI